MSTRKPRVQPLSVSAGVLVVVAWWSSLCYVPHAAVAQSPSSQPSLAPVQGTAESEEIGPLTPAQQEARQLATLLLGKREVPATASPKAPLQILAEQTLQLGQRLIVPLTMAWQLEIRLVGGRQTFVSPVEQEASAVTAEAQRPLFLPASQAAVAIEALVK